MPDLRKTFWEEMGKVATEQDETIVLTGDLGFSFMEDYASRFPSKFINCGAIEQSMVGIAAGMSLGGKKPYVYSGAIFLLMRAYEQVRDDIAFNKLDVKLIGTGASSFLGFTHNLVGEENEEDLLKNLPIKRFYPENEKELSEALRAKGAAYIRI